MERIVRETDEKSHCAEVRRLRGTFLCRNGAVDRAASYLKQAIDWARQRQARVFELRASRDLARLHLDEGRRHAATVVLKRALTLFPEEPVITMPCDKNQGTGPRDRAGGRRLMHATQCCITAARARKGI